MMNQEIKQQWVAALRSGEYVQGTDRLKQTEEGGCTTHCCLGVLTELYAKEHNIEFTGKGAHLKGVNPLLNQGAFGELLCEPVIAWSGIGDGDTNIMVSYKGTPRSLASLNDIDRVPFSAIADLIEAQL